MKKLSILVGALTLTSSLFAQDLTSKKGENYMPEQGDWALGIDAVPFLNYFGNFIGGDGLNVAPNWNWASNNQTIVGKYFVEEKMAYRGALRIGFGSTSTTVMVADRAADNSGLVYPAMPPMKENVMKDGAMNIGLAGGLEWRKGNTRLQGFYGAELGFNLGSNKETYDYGNGLVANVAEPAFVGVDPADDFGTGNMTTDSYGNDARVLEAKTSMFGLGLRGFIGAEYFVLPKLSVGAEFGWGLGFMSMSGSTEIESIGNNGAADVVGTQTMEADKVSMFGIDTDINNTVFGNPGQLKITLHF
ncbi:MAG: hypothetical protein K0R65_271 [Crocinitomicaceae bacterium]|jgi:hypothetical protein|nr:hypothetical protein [Crocinitomicaceae bacterium]